MISKTHGTRSLTLLCHFSWWCNIVATKHDIINRVNFIFIAEISNFLKGCLKKYVLFLQMHCVTILYTLTHF